MTAQARTTQIRRFVPQRLAGAAALACGMLPAACGGGGGDDHGNPVTPKIGRAHV